MKSNAKIAPTSSRLNSDRGPSRAATPTCRGTAGGGGAPASGRCRGRRGRRAGPATRSRSGEEVREVCGVERHEEVFPGRQSSRSDPSLRASGEVRRAAEYATDGGYTRPEYAMPGGYTRPQTSRRLRPPSARGWEDCRLRALLSVANRDGIAGFARDLLDARRRDLRHRRHPRAPRRRRHRGRLRLRADRRPAARRRPGQDVPPRGLRRHPRPPRRARASSTSSRPTASA